MTPSNPQAALCRRRQRRIEVPQHGHAISAATAIRPATVFAAFGLPCARFVENCNDAARRAAAAADLHRQRDDREAVAGSVIHRGDIFERRHVVAE